VNAPPTEDDDGDDAADDEDDDIISNDDGEDDDDDEEVIMHWLPAVVTDSAAGIPLDCKGFEAVAPTGSTNLDGGLAITLGMDCSRIGVFPLPIATAAAAGDENVTCAMAGCPTGSIPIFSVKTPSELRDGAPFICT
jgi:hypothetical protein